jgi:hypothetical protein
MRLIYPIVILFLLESLSAGQLAPDRERFDIVLHPGEVEEKTLTLTNSGDTPIFKIDSTPVSGNAKDLIFMDMPEIEMLPPEGRQKAYSSPFLLRLALGLTLDLYIYWIALRLPCP